MTITTTERRPARLVNISLNELSLVDRPANPHAKVTLFKSSDDPPPPMAFDSFEEAMQHLQKLRGLTRSDAMSAAARAHPALVEKYQRAGDAAIAKAAEAARPQPVNKAAVLAFDDRVDQIAKSRGIPRHAAMSVARDRHSAEFVAAYGEGGR